MKKYLKILFTNIYTITFVYLAIVSQAIFVSIFLLLYQIPLEISDNTTANISLIFVIFYVLAFGYFIGRKKDIKNSFFFSFFPSFLILILLLTAWFIAFYVAGNDFNNYFYVYAILSINYPIFIFSTIFGKPLFLFYSVIFVYITFIVGFYLGIKKQKITIKNKKIMFTCIIVVFILICLCLCQIYINSQYLISNKLSREEASVERLDTYEYKPFSNSSKITKPKTHPTITFENNYPTIDGATALYPIYASAVEFLYKNIENKIDTYVKSSTTPYAYKNLIDGKVDMIFTLEPSNEQLLKAKESGVEFIFTPIAKEAFVFFVNKNNIINNLSVENIQDIYSGKITNWGKAGGENTKILAFQRPINSGSQTIMLNHIMKNIKIKRPLEEEYFLGMGGIANRIANYRNVNEAIGYSFRFYLTQMLNQNNIKLLNINDITPNAENIQNNTYPFITTIYIVSTKNTSQNGKKLIDWFLSEQGQKLIKDVGYIPIINAK